MESLPRFPAFLAYIPVIGWIYVLLLQRNNPLAVFHMRQSLGLFAFLLAVFAGWAVGTWILAWIPFGLIVGTAFFAMVILALIFGFFAWIMGMINAIQGRMVLLPVFGRIANQMPL